MAKIAEIIKYEGDNSTFVWKHPCEDFNSWTQLIVHESQEALFFMNGQALDLFGPGRYTLETQNIPILGGVLKRATGGESPFHCEVYFINKTVQMAVKWGTDSKVRFLDPTYGVPLEIGACGEMNLMVSDSRKLLTKVVGTMNGVSWDERGGGFTKSLAASFRPLISSAVKANLASCIKAQHINILEVDESLGLLSDVLKTSITPGFEEYGLTIPNFYVTTVVPEMDTNYNQLRELHATSLRTSKLAAERQIALEADVLKTEMARREAERQLIKAQADAQSAKIEGFAVAEVQRAQGYTQKDVIQADVQKAYAEGLGNMTISGGSVAGDMIGMGVGVAAAGALSGRMGEMFKGFAPEEPAPINKVTCPNCNAEISETAKFCSECGKKVEILKDGEMICPACGQKTAKGKFCMECGASLIAKCEKCGAELPQGAKFCLECGEKV